MTESWKNVLGVLGSRGKVLEFFVSRRVEILINVADNCSCIALSVHSFRHS